ncbi:hypothetical protein O2V63_11870 [Modestobacter sp. VKM Ac-2977]|nr:hypothetical protein [Modestobacter sp. VKM Ac-2977]MCZ2821029.1 hypothetical protein [Modestobacter sp. VKM Ac-2977]
MTAVLRDTIGTQAGDTVEVHLTERITTAHPIGSRTRATSG